MNKNELPIEDVPEYAELMSLEEWQNAVEAGAFIPDDGTGYYATATKMNREACSFGPAPAWATHVAWFNK